MRVFFLNPHRVGDRDPLINIQYLDMILYSDFTVLYRHTIKQNIW